MNVTLKSALLGLVVLVLLAGMVPAGLLLDHRLVAELEEGVRSDLASAPLVFESRFEANAGMWMMHAREISAHGALGAALSRGADTDAASHARGVAEAFPGEDAVLVSEGGAVVTGPEVPPEVVELTRAGEMPVLVVQSEEGLGTVALAPVKDGDRWVGAAGVWIPMDQEEAARLSVLTRSDVLLRAPDGALAAYTGRAEPAMGLFGMLADRPVGEDVDEFSLDGSRYLVVGAPMPGGGRVSFVRSLDEELAVVPALRVVGAGVLGVALVLALLVGVAFSSMLARPVGSLGEAASRIAAGDFDAPVQRSSVTEVDQVAEAFEVMRDALAARIAELGAANRELEDRQERLSMLQAELVQRDRLPAAARLLAQLAHEVRNPVASVRNCLEILRRRVDGDAEASELADLAIDELLRMHELAERMLDLHRPRATDGDCDAMSVAHDVASVVRMGLGDRNVAVTVTGAEPVRVEMPPDALKQILLNLVQNALDAIEEDGAIDVRVERAGANARIDVVDTGHGIGADALPQIFDPFFTTKADVRGVGLGLFTAAGIVRSYGGRIAAANRRDGAGARLTVEVPVHEASLRQAMA